MAAEQRVSVKTRVPQYQKDAWKAHATTLDMSQSEYVRTMVQAGRQDFELEPPESPSRDANPRGNVVKEPILEALSAENHLEFDHVVDSLADELESLVDEALQALIEDGEVEYSGRQGYRRTGASHGGD